MFLREIGTAGIYGFSGDEIRYDPVCSQARTAYDLRLLAFAGESRVLETALEPRYFGVNSYFSRGDETIVTFPQPGHLTVCPESPNREISSGFI